MEFRRESLTVAAVVVTPRKVRLAQQRLKVARRTAFVPVADLDVTAIRWRPRLRALTVTVNLVAAERLMRRPSSCTSVVLTAPVSFTRRRKLGRAQPRGTPESPIF